MAMRATTCPYCGVGCGLLAETGVDGMVRIGGDPDHPANFGRLCSKGTALGETLDLEGRLLYPEVDGKVVSWDAALETVADGLRRIIAQDGPDAVAFYVSGQLLTEDYYVANKLMKGFIGSGNIDTNSRLCMASAVAGHVRAFGSDTVPGCYEDVERAELIVLAGSNAAWCHPVLYQRIARSKQRRPDMKVVVIDPRRTATCDIADLHLSLRPGTDAVLFNGLLNFLRREDKLDLEFLEHRTDGFAAALNAARETAPAIPAVAAQCELPEAQVAEFFRWFAATEKTVTLFSQGINQSSSGTDKVNGIMNCHLATGRIGRPGMGPFSLTGQPNAMGGREVGGLANQLAAHIGFDDPQGIDLVARFWDAPRIATRPGRKAVEMFEAIERGRIKAIWIMATNPAVSLPDAERMRGALARCELVIVSDCVRETDTTVCADVLLPAATWGEKNGTVTNSERRISRQRAFRKPPGKARPDWWIITQVARRMGFAAQFSYESPAAIFREHAALSGFENDGRRDFDIGALQDISDKEYARLTPVQWPVTRAAPAGTARMFSDGGFFTPTGRARMVAITPRVPANVVNDMYPLVLNTGRVRDHWHTLTRTGQSARLSAHASEPFVQIHPADAKSHGLGREGLARVASRWGEIVARVALSFEQRPGSVFVPMHWNGQYASLARVNGTVNPAIDPVSGQPEFKYTPARVMPYSPEWYGFVLSRSPIDVGALRHWVRVRGSRCWRYEIAGEDTPEDWRRWARGLVGEDGEWLDLVDRSAGRYRGAVIRGARLAACVFISSAPDLLPRDWLAALFTQQQLSEADRMSLLAGRGMDGQRDEGRAVCACSGVRSDAIVSAIRDRGLVTVEAIGAALGAGNNCGSCVPEIKALIAAVRGRSAA